MILLTIAVICVMLLLAAALAFGYGLTKNPPVIRIEVHPPEIRQVEAPVAAAEPIPEEVLDYIDMESDEYARTTRRNRARSLRAELGSWPSAFAQLQREDIIR